MRILDGCCGAGGASVGIRRAGFDEVVGVDIEPQPDYPFEFIRADVLDVLADESFVAGFDGFHLSAPCQAWSTMSKAWNGKADQHLDLITPGRVLLEATGKPYVIENVPGAPLRDPVKLCGSMFDLAVERHRLFEANFPIVARPCAHGRQRELWPGGFPPLRSGREGQRARVVGVYGNGGGEAKDVDLWRWAMGIDWMTSKHGVAESIPPIFAEYVALHMRAHLLSADLGPVPVGA